MSKITFLKLKTTFSNNWLSTHLVKTLIFYNMLLVAKYNPVKTSKTSRRKIFVKLGAKIGAKNAQNDADDHAN